MDGMGLGDWLGERRVCVCKPLSSCAEETGQGELSEGPGSRGEQKPSDCPRGGCASCKALV